MIENKGIFWKGRDEYIFFLPLGSEEYPQYDEAFDHAALVHLSMQLEVPPEELEPERVELYKDSLLRESEAAELLSVSPRHRLWQQVLEDSEVEPAFTFRYQANPGSQTLHTGIIYNSTDIPKLAITAEKYNKPPTAKRITEVAAALKVAPMFIDDTLRDIGVTTEAFRDPSTLEFDEFLTEEALISLLIAIRERRASYRAR